MHRSEDRRKSKHRPGTHVAVAGRSGDSVLCDPALVDARSIEDVGASEDRDMRFAISNFRLLKFFGDCSASNTNNWKSAIGNRKLSYQIPAPHNASLCEPRQAGNGATVATAACVAVKSGVWPVLISNTSSDLSSLLALLSSVTFHSTLGVMKESHYEKVRSLFRCRTDSPDY